MVTGIVQRSLGLGEIARDRRLKRKRGVDNLTLLAGEPGGGYSATATAMVTARVRRRRTVNIVMGPERKSPDFRGLGDSSFSYSSLAERSCSHPCASFSTDSPGLAGSASLRPSGSLPLTEKYYKQDLESRRAKAFETEVIKQDATLQQNREREVGFNVERGTSVKRSVKVPSGLKELEKNTTTIAKSNKEIKQQRTHQSSTSQRNRQIAHKLSSITEYTEPPPTPNPGKQAIEHSSCSHQQLIRSYSVSPIHEPARPELPLQGNMQTSIRQQRQHHHYVPDSHLNNQNKFAAELPGDSPMTIQQPLKPKNRLSAPFSPLIPSSPPLTSQKPRYQSQRRCEALRDESSPEVSPVFSLLSNGAVSVFRRESMIVSFDTTKRCENREREIREMTERSDWQEKERKVTPSQQWLANLHAVAPERSLSVKNKSDVDDEGHYAGEKESIRAFPVPTWAIPDRGFSQRGERRWKERDRDRVRGSWKGFDAETVEIEVSSSSSLVSPVGTQVSPVELEAHEICSEEMEARRRESGNYSQQRTNLDIRFSSGDIRSIPTPPPGRTVGATIRLPHPPAAPVELSCYNGERQEMQNDNWKDEQLPRTPSQKRFSILISPPANSGAKLMSPLSTLQRKLRDANGLIESGQERKYIQGNEGVGNGYRDHENRKVRNSNKTEFGGFLPIRQDQPKNDESYRILESKLSSEMLAKVRGLTMVSDSSRDDMISSSGPRQMDNRTTIETEGSWMRGQPPMMMNRGPLPQILMPGRGQEKLVYPPESPLPPPPIEKDYDPPRFKAREKDYNHHHPQATLQQNMAEDRTQARRLDPPLPISKHKYHPSSRAPMGSHAPAVQQPQRTSFEERSVDQRVYQIQPGSHSSYPLMHSKSGRPQQPLPASQNSFMPPAGGERGRGRFPVNPQQSHRQPQHPVDASKRHGREEPAMQPAPLVVNKVVPLYSHGTSDHVRHTEFVRGITEMDGDKRLPLQERPQQQQQQHQSQKKKVSFSVPRKPVPISKSREFPIVAKPRMKTREVEEKKVRTERMERREDRKEDRRTERRAERRNEKKDERKERDERRERREKRGSAPTTFEEMGIPGLTMPVNRFPCSVGV